MSMTGKISGEAHDEFDFVPRRGEISDSSVSRFEFVAECDLPTERGNFRLRGYRFSGSKVVMRNGERVLEPIDEEPVVLYKGSLAGKQNVMVRVHDQCFTSEVMGSRRCDCKEQLELAMDMVLENEGAIIYLPQEGRGIGLSNKIAAYQLQDSGFDTVDANRLLGFGDDERTYSCVPLILQDMGIRSIELVTNNPLKESLLTDLGVKITRRRSCLVRANPFNSGYLRAKAQRMAHRDLLLDPIEPPRAKSDLASADGRAGRAVPRATGGGVGRASGPLNSSRGPARAAAVSLHLRPEPGNRTSTGGGKVGGGGGALP
eukprot:CAMPEP_0113663664 /NCGR_PEP_ID=MMETSP0038_2-20120614/1284_1 /TAXON_ID=2898 /ORGANISM="Cryptomonas paramecium" /LENGTH=316 /DNA_ID=CAMNT_0000578749 /DNA_START=473 /DNA_END=1423 /DNA_ORIENTATION=- /assembly_acc=CAM_ASM_000170